MATGSSVMSEKTRWKLKKIIQEYLLKILRNPNHKDHKRLLTDFPLLVKDPRNFQETRVKLMNSNLTSHHCAATKLLEGLEDMPSQTLSAMRRKLNGVQGDPPQLHPAKSGWTRDRLVKFVRRKCTNMLSKVSEGDELQKPLAKAMAVAVLSLKLTMKNPNISMPDFCRFSPDIEGLQNEILKAIWFLKKMNIRNLEVKDLQSLLDPKAEIPNSHFRPTIRRMLIEYLFECSDMVIIPNPLLETIAIITRSCSPNVAAMHFSKEDIEEEVEIVLSISSQMKQIAWDWLSDRNIDEEFTDAYMEDIIESDDDDQLLEPQIGESICSDEESIGESTPDDYVLPTSTSDGNGSPLSPKANRNIKSNSHEGSEPEQIIFPDSGNPYFGSSSTSCQESSVPHRPQHTSGNQYLAIQEICDDTSLFAHRLIGRVLDEFLHIESVDIEESKSSYLRGGLSSPGDCAVSKGMRTSDVDMSGPVLVKVVEELLPNFTKSGIERVKEFMGIPP
ncbi:hypothetical protein BVC80_123g3 [Macleaya cordata]|uniref:Uncharacterized protein n=1 Tax=Macleaya cordata TaxID=56857 RepID=A0A200QE72_MACCD|nr:hypothetical protein BVC80_123g3 [Macleaya cordata]